jgi:hypothetical protein
MPAAGRGNPCLQGFQGLATKGAQPFGGRGGVPRTNIKGDTPVTPGRLNAMTRVLLQDP